MACLGYTSEMLGVFFFFWRLILITTRCSFINPQKVAFLGTISYKFHPSIFESQVGMQKKHTSEPYFPCSVVVGKNAHITTIWEELLKHNSWRHEIIELENYLVGGFNISQNGSFPQVGLKIRNVWNHHPVIC